MAYTDTDISPNVSTDKKVDAILKRYKEADACIILYRR